MKIVGILLSISLLIIPAAAARNISCTPERMAIVAVLFGIISVVGGLGSSLQWDTPSGPSIVLAAFVFFCWRGLESSQNQSLVAEPEIT